MSDNTKAILTISVTASVLYVIGFYCLLKPRTVRAIYLKDYSRSKIRWPFYNQRKAVMSTDGYLTYLRIMGVIIILFASLLVYILFRFVLLT
jgi:hypothetical protein